MHGLLPPHYFSTRPDRSLKVYVRVLMETWAHAGYTEARYDIRFWRTNTGMEVDFVLGEGEVAVEVKGASRVDPSDLSGLKAFVEERKPRAAYLVCQEPEPRQVGNILILPWREYFGRLWTGDIIR